MNKNDLRVIKTKDRIYSTLSDLLRNKPLTHITVSELCREAKINRGTFYFHYQEVGDIFLEMFEGIMLDLKESYNEPFRQIENLDEMSLDPKVVRIFHHVEKYQDFYKYILSEDVPSKFYYMLFDEIRSISIESGNMLIHGEFNGYLSSYRSNAIIGLIIEWYRNNFQESADGMNVHLVNILKFKP